VWRNHSIFTLHIGKKQYLVSHRADDPDHWQYGSMAFATIKQLAENVK